MDIIFVALPKYMFNISILLKKTGFRVYYLKISGCKEGEENFWVEKLKHKNVLPLPIESISHFEGYSEGNSDPKMKLYKKTQKIASNGFFSGFKKLYPNIRNLDKKLCVVIHSVLANQMISVTSKINIWAKKNPDIRHILIDFNLSGLYTYELESNVILLVLPFEDFFRWFYKLIKKPYNFYLLLNKAITTKKEISTPAVTKPQEPEKSRVAFVTHMGLNYAKLFQKDIFYSSNINSEFHPEQILHFDYNGLPSPSKNIKWENIGNHRQSWSSNMYYGLIAMSHGILHIRHFYQLPVFFILIRSYIIYRSFLMKLELHPYLKVLLIDYEILCPKELSLASETKGIKTVAVTERFIQSMNYFLYGSAILSDYLCISPFTVQYLEKSPLFCVDKYIPVGQYRSDNLILAKRVPSPQILKDPISKGKKIITALGFHTLMNWQDSQVEPLINWSAHQQFLDDMIQLSIDIPDVFIVLRYKFIDWTSLPIFSETLCKIESSENITISKDYDESYISYNLCAHSDLVIAKPTSLGDECLSVGIPVLFHEYTHNTERIISDAFDYGPTRIMCYNYAELRERTQIILQNTPNAMTEDYKYLQNVVYGGFGDGKVRERVHLNIQRILENQ